MKSNNSMALPFTENLLLQAKQNIDGLGFIIRQNCSSILENQTLSKENQDSFDKTLKSIIKTLNLNLESYSLHYDNYSTVGTLIFSLLANNFLKNNQIEKLQKQSPINESKCEQLQKSYDSLKIKYDEVCANAKRIAENSPDAQEFTVMKQNLESAEKRIQFQAIVQGEEIKKYEKKIKSLEEINSNLEKEIEEMQAASMKNERSNKEKLSKISSAFGLDSCESTDDVISEIKQRLDISNSEDNLCSAIEEKRNVDKNNYEYLLQSFDVTIDSKSPQSEITRSVRKRYENELIRTLQKNYGTDAQGSNLHQIIENIITSNRNTIKTIISAFSLPPKIDNRDIVEALKEKIRICQRSSLLQRISNPDMSVREVTIEHDSSNERISELQKANDNFIEEINDLRNKNEAKESDIKILEEEKEKLTQEIAGLKEELTKAKNDTLLKKKSQKTHLLQKKVDKLSNMLNELVEKLSEKKKENQTLKQDNETTKRKVLLLEESYNKEKYAFSELKQQTETQISQINEENNQLRQELENSQLQQSIISNAPMESDTTKKLQSIFDDMMERYDNQCEELSLDSKYRLKLIGIVRKQSEMINKYEELLKKLSEEQITTVAVREIHEPILAQPKSADEIDGESLISTVEKIECNENVKDVLTLINKIVHEEDETTSAKLSNLIDSLLDIVSKSRMEMNEAEKLNALSVEAKQEVISRIINLLQKQTFFIEKVASSNITIDGDLRSLIIESVAKTQCFLSEHGLGLVDDNFIYNATNFNSDPLQFQREVEEFFLKYQDIESDEGQELLIILAQSVAICSLMRRYGTEAQTQITRLSNELKRVRGELKSTRKEMERKIKGIEEDKEKIVCDLEEKSKSGEEIIESVKNILRANITNMQLLQPIVNALESLKDGDIEYTLDPQEYNDAVVNELQKTRIEIENARNEEGELQKEREITAIEEEEENKEVIELQERIVHLQGEIDGLKEEVNKGKEYIKATNEKYIQLESHNEKLQKALHRSENNVKNLENCLTDVEQVTKDKYKSRFEKALNSILIEQKKKNEYMQRQIKIAQKENAAIIEQKDQELNNAEQKYNNLVYQKEMVEQELKTSEKDAQALVGELRAQIRKVTDQKISSELETKVLQRRIKTAEERVKREKDNTEAQYSLKLLRKDDEYREKESQIKEDFEDNKIKFLTNVVAELREFADPTIPVTEANIINLMTDIYARLKFNERNNERIEDLERQMREIRKVVDAPKGMRTVVVIKNLINKINEANAKTQMKEKTNNVDEWDSWARRISQSIFDGKQIESKKKLMQMLEDALFSSVKDKSLINKIELLRTQKKILKENDLTGQNKYPTAFCSIICSFMFIRRIQKLSHHIPIEIAVNVPDMFQEDNSANANKEFMNDVPMNQKEDRTSITEIFGKSISALY